MRHRSPRLLPEVTCVVGRMLARMLRTLLCLLIALVLGACAGTSGGSIKYDPNRCDRNGDESQRRAC